MLLIWLGAVPVLLGASPDWPQFLGPARDGAYLGPSLTAAWPKEGLQTVWQKNVGQGFSGPVVQDGKLILFHRLGDKEVVECLKAADGQPLWRYDYLTAYRDDFGFDPGPRATPSIAEGKVFTFGAEGALHCLDLATGRKVWALNVKEQFRSPKGFFGMACSTLVMSNKVLLNIGGTDGAGIVAFDRESGKLLWKSTSAEPSYSSPVDALLGGQRRALFFTRSGLVALDPENGKVQFEFAWRSRGHASVNAATPLVIDNLIFLSASYETGAVLLRLEQGKLTRVWSSDEALSNHYATSVHRNGFVYGYHGRQESGPSLRCIELRTGKVQWDQESFGAGSILLAGDKLLVLKEDGQLLLLEATPKSYRELARAQVLSNGVRAYPAVASGFVFARSKDQLVCLDLREGQ